MAQIGALLDGTAIGVMFAGLGVAAAFVLFIALVSELRHAARLGAIIGRWRHLRGHAQRLPYRAMVRPWCQKLQSGAYLAALEITAPDGDTLDARMLGQSDVRLSRGVQVIDPECAGWFVMRRVRVRGYDRPADAFAHPVLEFIDELQAAFFGSGRTFTSARTLFVAWKPPSELSERLRRAATVGGEETVRSEDDILDDFEKKHLTLIQNAFEMGGAKVRRIADLRSVDRDGNETVYAELTSALSYSVSHRTRHYRLSDAMVQAGAGLLAASEFRGGAKVRVGDREFAFVCVKGLPDALWPRKLSRLKSLGIEYSVVVRWLPHTTEHTRKVIRDARATWLLTAGQEAGGDEQAEGAAGQAAKLRGVLSKQIVAFGDTSVWVVLSHRDRAKVDDQAGKVVALLEDLGIKSFAASLTSEAEYLAQLPGMVSFGVRRYPLHSLNVAHLVNFHEESAGRRYNESPTFPARTPAIATIVTPELEPYRVHVNGDPRDVGDTYLVGRKGVGKSVAMGTLAVLAYARQPFTGVSFFDSGASSYRITRFLDGTFTDLLKSATDTPGMAIYSSVHRPEDRGPLLEILCAMAELNGVPMTATRDGRLSKALNLMGSSGTDEAWRGKVLRSHAGMCELLQDPSGELKAALLKYERNGEIGRTVDCETDTFAWTRWSVVEMRRLFTMGPKYVIPVLMAVIWKMRSQVRQMKECEGRYDLHWRYFIDEAHNMLERSHGAKFIKDMFREGRRENLDMALASQQMGHFYYSDCWEDIKSTCGAAFFFGNPGLAEPEVATSGDRATLHQQYREAGVSERGIRRLAHMAPNSFLYRTNEGEMKVGRFHLDDASRALLAMTRQSDNDRVDEHIGRYGLKNWRWELLKTEGVNPHTIARCKDLYERWTEGGERDMRGPLQELTKGEDEVA